MQHFRPLAFPFLTFYLALQVKSEDLNATIVGCEAVGCPLDNFTPHCTVSNITFENIGLTRIPDVPDSLLDFSIVKGVNISGVGANDFTSVYYLGTPDDVSLDEVQGCAVLFHDPPQDTFERNGTHTCSEVINQKCIDAIQDRAAKIGSGNSKNLCADLKEDLEESDLKECENLTGGGKGIGNISTTALSSLKNIEGDSNSTSDCWPILPKSANLAPMFTELNRLEGGLNASTAYPELGRISPLLTVFVKGNGKNESVVDKTVSRLSCISLDSTQNDGPEDGRNAGSRLNLSHLVVGGAFAVFMLTL